MQYNDFCVYYQKIVAKRTISISNVFINTINTKKKKKKKLEKKLQKSYWFINKNSHMIYCIQIVSEKTFCHSQVSMVYLQIYLVPF